MGSLSMTILLDTDVLVDCLRGTKPAQEWLGGAANETFKVPGIVAMELVIGCRNKTELDRVQKFLGSFDVIWPEASEFALAHELLTAYYLASGLNIPDCLIAAMALSRSARLYTFNVKHFQMVAGLNVQSPYLRF
jgi:hypothetical protein